MQTPDRAELKPLTTPANISIASSTTNVNVTTRATEKTIERNV